MHVDACVCDAAPRLDLRTRLLLIMHRGEVAKSTATGNLAMMALVNSELRIHGDKDAPLDLRDLDHSARRVLLLFPAETATPLTAEFVARDPRPVTLVVPDGSWRQARKFGRRIPGLDRAEQVTLPPGPPSRYRLRAETRECGLATFEAISRALAVLEGPDVQTQLDALFHLMVERTLASRGVAGQYYMPRVR
jgi:DTW domain-containing protein